MTEDMFNPEDLEMKWRVVERRWEWLRAPDTGSLTYFPTYVRTEPVDISQCGILE